MGHKYLENYHPILPSALTENWQKECVCGVDIIPSYKMLHGASVQSMLFTAQLVYKAGSPVDFSLSINMFVCQHAVWRFVSGAEQTALALLSCPFGTTDDASNSRLHLLTVLLCSRVWWSAVEEEFGSLLYSEKIPIQQRENTLFSNLKSCTKKLNLCIAVKCIIRSSHHY